MSLQDERRITVAIIQPAAWGSPASFDVDANRARLLALIERACEEHRPDLVGLPEIASAPYFCGSHDPRYWDLAEPVPGPTTDAVGELAARYGCTVLGGIFEKGEVEGEYYGSCFCVGPDGRTVPARIPDGRTFPAARKIHIPTVYAKGMATDEKHWFRPAEGISTFDTAVGRIGILICYDRSFPEAWRTLVLQGADAVFVPVASNGFREELFLAELRTRANENGIWALASNRAGLEQVEGVEVCMFGTSCVVDPSGEVVARGSSGSEGKGDEIVVAEIDLAEVARQRIRVPFLRDRRPEVYVL